MFKPAGDRTKHREPRVAPPIAPTAHLSRHRDLPQEKVEAIMPWEVVSSNAESMIGGPRSHLT